MDNERRTWRNLPWGRLLFAVLAVAVLTAALWRWGPSWPDAAAWLPDRKTPPSLFIGLMLVVPLVGAPISIFFILSGVILGTWKGLAVCAVSITVHAVVAYLIAHGVGRQALLAILHRMHYEPPKIPHRHMVKVTIAFFTIPGLPYAAKAYLFALTDVPFTLYVTVSLVSNMVYATICVILGDAVMEARWRLLAVAAALLIIAHLAIVLLRKRVSRRA